jgi:hypothetical protein
MQKEVHQYRRADDDEEDDTVSGFVHGGAAKLNKPYNEVPDPRKGGKPGTRQI